MKNLVLVFVVAFAFCTTVMASDIAFYVGAPNIDGWYDVSTQTTDVATIIAETGHLFSDIQQFDDDQYDAFGAWVEANTNDGEMDIIWLNGCMPSVLYPFPNLEPDGSLVEEWLDGGNMIINVGDWFGYVSYAGGSRQTENGPSGAANILDLSSGIIVSADNTSLTVTPTGKEYLPSLNDPAITYRPVALTAVQAPWEVAAIFASSGGTDDAAAEAQADPVVIHNTETGGYVAFVNQSAGSGPPGWIDDRGLTCAEFISNWVSNVVGLGYQPLASGPKPKDGTLYKDTWITLSWRAGYFAVSHDVYLSDNFDDVNEGTGDTFRGNQTALYYVAGFPGFAYPDGLVPGTTYYWRIDEVNEAEPNSPWKGDVWSFSIPPKTAYFPEPADGAELIDLNVVLSWTAGFGAKLHYIVFGEDFDEVNDAAMGTPNGTTNYSPGPLKLAKTYYWRVDEFEGAATHKGEVWSFTTEGAASGPDPSNGAVGVKPTAVLRWDAGTVAASHEVYFGTDSDVVKNATTASPEYKGPKALGEESYDPGKLMLNTAYYWRVEEVNSVNPDSPWAGNVWSFTTGDFFAIDDFEDYDVGDNQIWYEWHDGLGYGTPGTADYFAGNGTGAAVGDETTASYTEETIVHGGGKSMPVVYDNNKQGYAYYSEVEHTLTVQRNWTEEGMEELSLWFYGDSNNSDEPLYVAVSNSAGTPAVVVHDDPAAAQIDTWTQWVIPLQALADQGITLTNVDRIAIGLGTRGNMATPGGSGKMYFDDIRLYHQSEAAE